MAYVLENKDIEGQYIAKNMDVAFSSTLDNGDVIDLELALIFDDEFDLMCFAAEQGVHRTVMKMVYGEDAIVSMDIDVILQNYRPKKGESMTDKERETIIAELAFSEGVRESVYKDYTDKELVERLEYLFGAGD